MLRSSDGTIYNLDPQTSRAALGPVIDLFLGTITGVTIDGNHTVARDRDGNPITVLGTLTLDFADGAQLTVPAAATPYDDSWELSYRYDQPDSRIRLGDRRMGRRGKHPGRSGLLVVAAQDERHQLVHAGLAQHSRVRATQ